MHSRVYKAHQGIAVAGYSGHSVCGSLVELYDTTDISKVDPSSSGVSALVLI